LAPVVVADGFCPSCGTRAPIEAYLDVVRDRLGTLVIDDTQALGILGASPSARFPYGTGGGGSLRHAGVIDAAVIIVSSLAKAFGAPIAAIAGSARSIAAFVGRSDTRIHCSPPSAAALHAAARALALNASVGERLRGTLWGLVRRFRGLLEAAGLPVGQGLFPVQTIPFVPGINANALHRSLRSRGIATILQGDHHGLGNRVSFIITSRHRSEELEHAVATLATAMRAAPRTRRQQGVSHGRALEREYVIARGCDGRGGIAR
jgi:8-amino-7-oxononanoate synthase